MPTPAITITGTFKSITGASTGYVTFTLQNYGGTIPTLSGSGSIVQLVTTSAIGNTFAVQLFGNDVIAPSTTFYMVSFYAADGSKAADVPYRFTGTGSFDIATLAPMTTLPNSFDPNTLITSPTFQNVNVNGSLTVLGAAHVGSLTIPTFEAIRFADQFNGASVGAQIDAAIADLATAQGLVVIPSTMGAGWSLAGVPSWVTIWDLRGNGGSTQTSFVRGVDLYSRVTSVGSGLQIPSTLLLEQDAYSGGVNEYPTGRATKTQFQPLRIEMQGRTIGEKKGIELNVFNQGKGDNIGIMASTYDFGGYSTGGDEGSEGGRFQTYQGDGTASGGVPTGTVSTTPQGGVVTCTWNSGTNANLGEQRPLINTSRSVYNSGTIVSVTGSGSPVVCTVTGSGTLWAGLGTGPKTDMFLNITGNDSGSVRHVVPILNIIDNTHLVIEFNLAEFGASTFGSGMVTSGSYNIFRGGTVYSLQAPPSGSLHPTAVLLSSGSSNFFTGDTVEQPLGYNYHGAGVQIVVQSLLAPSPGTAGIKLNNVGTRNFGDALFINGNFDNLIRTGSTFSDSLLKISTPHGCFYKNSDVTAATQTIIQQLNSGLAARNFNYDRTNDAWVLGYINANAGSSATNGLLGVGTNAQPNTHSYFYYNSASMRGLVLAPAVNPSSDASNLCPFAVEVAGVPTFQVAKTRVAVNNGMDLKGYSDNLVTNKWSIAGATGNISTAGSLQIGGGTPITGTVVYSQTITPASVAAATAVEQTFTVTGLTTADKVIVNPAPTGNSTMVGAARVSAANTIAIQFSNPTAGALTPGAGTYSIIAIRS